MEELWSGARPTRPIRVIADGVFDLFHLGHANLFRQIKADLLPPWCEVYTIARTCSDSDSTALKDRPVQDERSRREMLRHCRYVDEVIYELAWASFPLGGLVIGSLAELVGLRGALAIAAGAVATITLAVFALSPRMRNLSLHPREGE